MERYAGEVVRFLENGADIPDELIGAVTDGSATFLCGAGVSIRAGLPSFERLTKQVYGRLGETPDDEPAEQDALARKEFDWASPDATSAWGARRYSNYIGSPELFGLPKQPFLALFDQPGLSSEYLRTFAEWLTAILIANNRRQEDHYPLTGTEARKALRKAGTKALSTVAHRLAIEMERDKPEERGTTWRTIVGPVFQAIWPLDVELQTAVSTFKLAQLLRATGDAFPEAADVIIPFHPPRRSPFAFYRLLNCRSARRAIRVLSN